MKVTHKSRFARVRKEAPGKRGIQVVQWYSLKHQVSGQRQNLAGSAWTLARCKERMGHQP